MASNGKQGKQHKNPKGDVGDKPEKRPQPYRVVAVWEDFQLLHITGTEYDLCRLNHYDESSSRMVTVHANSDEHACKLAQNFI